ncbi:hypothetical protein [Dactylosporangium sp. CA-092794]|uniref:hypothetical protein n=1 Tax=Dactylosporangium sp. CA-092794 TaxID=3239929 RepID=UPI003D9275EB
MDTTAITRSMISCTSGLLRKKSAMRWKKLRLGGGLIALAAASSSASLQRDEAASRSRRASWASRWAADSCACASAISSFACRAVSRSASVASAAGSYGRRRETVATWPA